MRIVFKVSGHHGHEGRPGEVGGSLPGPGVDVNDPEYQDRRARNREALRRYRAARRQEQQAAASQNPIDLMPVPSDVDVKVQYSYNVPNSMKKQVPEDILKKFFHIQDAQLVVSVSKESGDLTIRVQGIVNGKEYYQRVKIAGGAIDFEYLKIDAEGAGIGMPLVTKQIVMAKMMGFKEAKMFADITIGKYAWAKEGVEYAYTSDRLAAPQRFENWIINLNDMIQDTGEAPLNINDLPSDYRNYKYPYQWAKLKLPNRKISSKWIYNGDVKAGDYDIGKAFMLTETGHGSWHAKINLEELSF
jgi:hypothetical protein